MMQTVKFPVANIYVLVKRRATLHIVVFAALVLATPALALDLNSFRAQHGQPALSVSSTLSALAYSQAHSMAARTRLDHAGFRARIAGLGGGMHAENVAFGCDTEDCAIRMWSRSSGHRANMLRGDVAAYGIASATGANGRRYWALELGN